MRKLTGIYMTSFARLTDYGCAALHMCAITAYAIPELRAGTFGAPLIVLLALGAVAVGHVRGQKWAAQATTILLLMANAFCIFMLFPPYTVESGPGMQSIPVKVSLLVGVTVVCVGLCVILYFRQKDSKVR